MESHCYSFPVSGPDGLDCHRCGGRAPTVETTHLNHGLCRSCLKEALSLLPDEKSPRLRAYLALSEALSQVLVFAQEEQEDWDVCIRRMRSDLGDLYDGMTNEEREIVDKREVQR